MINVSCAIIVNQKREVFVAQRSASMKLPLKWEFPGGKIEENETSEECLIREIREELGIEIEIIRPLKVVEHHYDDSSIRLIPFVCKIKSGEIQLVEHASYQWVRPKELLDLDWAEADLPILKNFLNLIIGISF
jgi:8-oxo-dGTP diphosphatase